VISLEDAQTRILSAIQPLPAEEISLAHALGRFSAEPLHALVDLPPVDNSAMDGYAVQAADLHVATVSNKVALMLAAEVRAGEPTPPKIAPGACARIFTGAPLPSGADAVVMQEDVTREEGPEVRILFSEPAKPWENVRLRGEDVRAKALLLEAGEKISPQYLGVLAGGGVNRLRVFRQPVLGLLATGDELLEPGEPLVPGRIYESNRSALAALATLCGARPKAYPLLRDDLDLTEQALRRAFAECDAVVTTGGVSVGEMDWVKPAFEKMGGSLDFWKVEIRPGKPFAFGLAEGKAFFGLPGNPVSAMVTFFLLVRPALLRLQGARDVRPPVTWGKLAGTLRNEGERRHFMRVILDATGEVRSAGSQASHMLSSLSRSHGLVDVAPRTTLPSGVVIPVLRWD
jgi:molybdopterin molybdotransferase